MTNEQLYLFIGIPTVINAALTALLLMYINAGCNAIDKRFDDMLDQWRVDVWKK